MKMIKSAAWGRLRRTLAVAALTSVVAAPAFAGDIKIGARNALTGPIPDLAKVILESEQAAVAFINANGGRGVAIPLF